MKQAAIVGSVLVALTVTLGAQTTPPAAPADVAPPPAPPSRSTPARKSIIVDKVIVRVNGEILTQAELVRKQIDALRDRKIQVDNPQALQDDATLAKLLQDVTPGVLVDAVDELLLVQRGRELDIKFSDENYKDALEAVKKNNNWDDKQLAAALKQSDMTMDDLRQGLERSYIIKNVRQQEFGQRMQVTEEEDRQYYNQHKSDFMRPATVTLREILAPVQGRSLDGQPSFSVGDDNTAKAKIDAMKARLDKGEDFTAVAASAAGPNGKANDSVIGPISVEDLNPALAAVVAKLTPGQVSDPIRSTQGYQLVKLESRVDAGLAPFDSVRDQVEEKILDARLGTEMDKLVGRLRAQALIEWKDDGFKQMYEQQIRAKTPSTT